MTTQIVKVLADSDLQQNGGQFAIEGNVAQPVINVGSSPKRALGGSAKPVYVVTQAQIDNGSFEQGHDAVLQYLADNIVEWE